MTIPKRIIWFFPLLMFVVALVIPFTDQPRQTFADAPKAAAASPTPLTCADLVKKAVQKVSGSCSGIGRNKVCYGNTLLSAEQADNVSNFKFEKPGDTTDLKNIRSLKLTAFNEADQTWGIAMLRVQANLPDTAPGQNVTALLFGDAQLTDDASAFSDAQSTAILASRTAIAPTVEAGNTLLAPTQQYVDTKIAAMQQGFQTKEYSTRNAIATNQQATVLAFATNQDATANARAANVDATNAARAASQSPTAQAQTTNQAGTVVARSTSIDATTLAKATNSDATVFARATSQLLTREAQNANQQSTFDARSTASYNTISAPLPISPFKPMQAFYFRSGVGESACADLPRDGMLVQSPGGNTNVKMSVDGTTLQIGSTIFMTAQPNGKLAIYTLEGSVGVSAFNVTQPALAGMVVRVPLDANLRASGPPEAPVPYVLTDLQGLPLRILPRLIKIADPRESVGAGSLVSSQVGDVCKTGSATVGNSTDGSDPYVVAVPVGDLWKATAGTTISVKATGDLLVQGAWRNYIALAPSGAGLAGPVEAAAFAVSGGSNSVTYTFTKDNSRFYIDIGITTTGGVSATITCLNSSSATGTTTPTPSITPTSTP